MSEVNDERRGRRVPMPDIYPVSHHVEMPCPTGPRNRVGEVALEPFSRFGGDDWAGQDVSVLTLWTDHPLRSPFRFCLSRTGVVRLREELDEFLRAETVDSEEC